MTGVGSLGLWIGFVAFVLAMLALDLGVFHRKEHKPTARESLVWSAIWVLLALAFGAGVYFLAGSRPALEFLTGYVIEKTLSVDNLFVFLIVFSAFKVGAEHQHRVLFWGVLGALVMRAVFIVAGTALLARFHWLIYVFGAFLVFTGGKLLLEQHRGAADGGAGHPGLEEGRLVRLLRRLLPMTEGLEGSHFVVRRGGRWLATPLLLVLAVVEVTDLIFALDSIPAVLAITGDPFIVFTSNVFAILGLRSFYFLLAGMLDRFRYLKVGLALVLIFVGAKMAASDVLHLPIALSLALIGLVLGASVAVSLLLTKEEERGGSEEAGSPPRLLHQSSSV